MVNKKIAVIIRNKLEAMLKSGAFPEVQYHSDGTFEQYSLYPYTLVNAKLSWVVSQKIIESLDCNGIFSKKRSAQFLENVKILVDTIAPEEVSCAQNRFKTWMD